MSARDALERVGFFVTDVGDPEPATDWACRDPYAFAEAVLGERPWLLERQHIRPTREARSIASSSGESPLHTDSQSCLGVPATVQILLCRRAAERGGESVLVDGFGLASHLDEADAELARALFDTPRAQTFYFGAVAGPTIARRGGHVCWTLAPNAADDVGRRLAPHVREAPRFERRLEPGAVLVASNHRMLHGRRAFAGGDRELVRLLVWLSAPLAAPRALASRARDVEWTRPRLGELPEGARAHVEALLVGAPPARVARDAGVAEETLYAWRDVIVAARSSGIVGA